MQQSSNLGSFIRNTYLRHDSNSFIQGISTDVAIVDQLSARAAGGGAEMIVNSAYALLQGLYPPTELGATTLATGQKVMPPLGGYQYIPGKLSNSPASRSSHVALQLYMVDPKINPVFNSWEDCNYFQFHLKRLYASALVKNMSTTAQPNNFTNMWNIYDYIHFQYTHNKSFYEHFPATYVQQARHYANWLQQRVFTDSVQNGIGEIAIRTLLPNVFWHLGNMTETANKVKIALHVVDYKPFISLFDVTNATKTDPDVAGIPEHASLIALELSKDTQGEHHVSMKFKNGTQNSEFRQLKMFGNDSITLKSFIKELAWTTINSTNNWCFSCNQTVLRGCSVFDFSKDPFLHGLGNKGYSQAAAKSSKAEREL
ncbi:phosphoglycerate mutase-like protein [Suillus paluster]|uniref:phosphoglycerate mutase-like protein n=1 Tax=Suillus paluster TaxID=48578 RepID=UPI001B86D117|nr:phosphoglycerate mutase-like protein [Suillus paluster]KAG1738675.1 phosphoglycerate mutase-like protein [Suillus paluster]